MCLITARCFANIILLNPPIYPIKVSIVTLLLPFECSLGKLPLLQDGCPHSDIICRSGNIQQQKRELLPLPRELNSFLEAFQSTSCDS